MDSCATGMFRQTLIGHARLRPSYEVHADRLSAFRVASTLRPRVLVPDLASHSPEEFIAESGITLRTATPLVKAAFTARLALAGPTWPLRISRPSRAIAVAGPSPGSGSEDPAADERGCVGLCSRLTPAVGGGWWSSGSAPRRSRPRQAPPLASRLARLQAASTNAVTNLRHEQINLGLLDVRLLRLLDGTREN